MDKQHKTATRRMRRAFTAEFNSEAGSLERGARLSRYGGAGVAEVVASMRLTAAAQSLVMDVKRVTSLRGCFCCRFNHEAHDRGRDCVDVDAQWRDGWGHAQHIFED